MENKRDASMAGLPWPLSGVRDAPSSAAPSSGAPSSGTSTTVPTPNPAHSPPSTSEAPTSIPPTSTANTSAAPTPYTTPPLAATPFPHAERLHYDFYTHPRHFERIVHQIQFKIYTGPTTIKASTLKRFQLQGFLAAAILNISSMDCPAIGTGRVIPRIIGATSSIFL